MEDFAKENLPIFPKRSSLDLYLSTQSHFILVVWSRKEKFLKDEAFENKEIENVE